MHLCLFQITQLLAKLGKVKLPSNVMDRFRMSNSLLHAVHVCRYRWGVYIAVYVNHTIASCYELIFDAVSYVYQY